MKDEAFVLQPVLFSPSPPFTYGFDPKRPGRWMVRDAAGLPLGVATTRAGARAAVRTLYTQEPADACS